MAHPNPVMSPHLLLNEGGGATPPRSGSVERQGIKEFIAGQPAPFGLNLPNPRRTCEHGREHSEAPNTATNPRTRELAGRCRRRMNSPGFVWCQDQNPIETLKMTIRRSDGIMDVFSITRSDRPRWMTAPEFGS